MKKFMENGRFTYAIIIAAVFFTIVYFKNFLCQTEKIYLVEQLKQPNFVFILTDDQDSWLKSMSYMENVNNLLAKDGLTFENSFVASPLCCPSRSSILTGQYVHNHRSINNSISGGCNSNYWRNGPERQTFIKLLHEHGYNNFFAGKYLNQYGNSEGGGGLQHIPPGWDWWIGLVGNSRYYDYNLSINGTKEEHAHDPDKDYLTNVIKQRALAYINQLPKFLNQPFFMMLSTPACHSPFTPEPKYSRNFTKENIPRTQNFNVVNGKGKHWLLRLGEQPLSDDTVDKLDDIYRQRLRTLLTVDDMVASVYSSLKERGFLDNTYLIFTSDNGYHLGQFALPFDKREPYEFDIRVPLIINGPNVRKGRSLFPAINVDIAPTILDLAGISTPNYIDGVSLKSEILTSNSTSNSLSRTVLIEHTGEFWASTPTCYSEAGLYGCTAEFQCKCSDSSNNTYACLRQLNKHSNSLYCAWSDNENFEEFYDLNADNNQLYNKIKSLSSRALTALRNYLKDYIKCKGIKCRQLSYFTGL